MEENEKEIKSPEQEAEEKGITFGLNLFTFEKWGKTQLISLFDFSSLNGVINTIKGLLLVALLIKLIKKK